VKGNPGALAAEEVETEYELFALTVHIGTLEMGHYIAFVKRYE
jgi:ubiquitin C-terminal hydrolase